MINERVCWMVLRAAMPALRTFIIHVAALPLAVVVHLRSAFMMPLCHDCLLIGTPKAEQRQMCAGHRLIAAAAMLF